LIDFNPRNSQTGYLARLKCRFLCNRVPKWVLPALKSIASARSATMLLEFEAARNLALQSADDITDNDSVDFVNDLERVILPVK
jgi:hypothetical protein